MRFFEDRDLNLEADKLTLQVRQHISALPIVQCRRCQVGKQRKTRSDICRCAVLAMSERESEVVDVFSPVGASRENFPVIFPLGVAAGLAPTQLVVDRLYILIETLARE